MEQVEHSNLAEVYHHSKKRKMRKQNRTFVTFFSDVVPVVVLGFQGRLPVYALAVVRVPTTTKTRRKSFAL